MKWKMSVRTCLAASLLALSLISTAGARIITVDDDGPADFNNIQAAINDANDGDVVEIKPGTYTGPGNYNISFEGNSIIVRGTNPDDFDIVAATIIDCNTQGTGFVFDSGEDANSVLIGLTITNGDDPFWHSGGGGIYCEDSSPIISNCIVAGNSGSAGGGIYTHYGNPIIRNCVITQNSASNGGGIYGTGNDCLTIENCIITANTARGEGGGVRSSAYVRWIKNCVLSGNRAGDFGGAISCRAGTLLVTGCTITANLAGEMGGGIRAYGSGAIVPIVSNSILWDNTAPVGSEIAIQEDGILTVSYCNLDGAQGAVYADEFCTLTWGPGNIDADPCFADPGCWEHISDPNIHVEPNDPNATWVDGDYHLKSQAGRWDADNKSWGLDDVTSLCIDAGDPMRPLGPEPFPNGGKVNIGAYSATTEASKSYFGEPPCETIVAGDVNGDCKIDGVDFAFIARHWLCDITSDPPGQASNPTPIDGAVGIETNPILSWTPSVGTLVHEVYLDTDSIFDTLSYKGMWIEPVYEASSLLHDTTYYWQVNQIGIYGKTTGSVWRFTTEEGGKPRSCFPADTLVWADGKAVPIVEVRPGQKVRMVDSAGEADGKFVPIVEMRPGREVSVFNNAAEVEWLQEHGVGAYDCYDMTFESGNSLVVVHSHNFLTVAGEWVAVENLRSGSKLQSLNGPITVTSVVKRAMPFVGNAYNLKIKGANLFFVGKDGVAAVDCSKLPKE